MKNCRTFDDKLTGNGFVNAGTYAAFKYIRRFMSLTLFLACCVPSANAQSVPPIIIQPPVVNMVDENHVSILDGKTHFSIPAVRLGDVGFTPYSLNGNFSLHQILDQNYGYIGQCQTIIIGTGGYGGRYDCAVAYGDALQAIHGEERATFHRSGTQYTPDASDGSTFVDNVAVDGTCTWTKRDGTKIVYAAFHSSSNPLCFSNNILRITYPDGRILTYSYYGGLSTSPPWVPSPILSIATNTGYMLKYIYQGTPSIGAQTSVIAFNRAFESCDPAAVSCTLQYTWPTATLSWSSIGVSPCDNFAASDASDAGGCTHHMFTIQDSALRKHIFRLNSIFRVITYQPPEATSPVFSYSLCEILAGNASMINCGGIDAWHTNDTPLVIYAPLMWDLVSMVQRNGQAWYYSSSFQPWGDNYCQPVVYSTWRHTVTTPLDKTMVAFGNATPGRESCLGPTGSITSYDGTVTGYARGVPNHLNEQTTPQGIRRWYNYDARSNLVSITQRAVSGSGLVSIGQVAQYNDPNWNKPTAIIDANGTTVVDSIYNPVPDIIPGHQTDFTYDPVHGGLLTKTAPAAPNGIRPQTRYTYAQFHAWYLNSSGGMTRDPNPVWLLTRESICQTGSSCTGTQDEVVTAYDYGPDSGPNNLILRGKTVMSNGQTLRSCYAHDKQGNKIWETSPNANPASCPAY